MVACTTESARTASMWSILGCVITGATCASGHRTAGTMAATAALWYVLPSKVRYLVPVLVLALEVPQVARNANLQALDARNHPNQLRAARGMSIKVRF